MKKIFTAFVVGIVMLCMVGAAQAGLLGDSISAAHYFPNLSTIDLNMGSQTVVAGTSDVFNYYSYYSVNPEDTSILVDFLADGGYSWVDATFNGLVISNIDDIITNVSIDTNLVGWDISRLSYDDHTLRANWQGLAFDSSKYFNFSLTTVDHLPTVPEPASLSLLATGLLGFLVRRKVLG
ncbi:MAG TPA: PEP-CTERM sorting domain-containing protein [Candidatus Omnitrophota bacterium]|nr:PEP-CTERM sorting domain-containing protein [Candidatus Omnitrophota bacterium]HPD85199.1 PEP-CTERM sorting domain-containing protein [Candidatus Omnitrophota bacterium]HRZ04300.1 PEP-CTERM sorting domain-containing protein [Candidatus Omnitrophota bacterium]